MKSQFFKLIAFIAFLTAGGLSCTEEKDEEDPNAFKWDDSTQQEEFRPINPGTKSSYFKIDNNILSFAVPCLVGTRLHEYLPEPDWGGCPNCFSPHFWTVTLIMDKGTDVSKLAPVFTLAPGATITSIETGNQQITEKEVNYTGIAVVGEYDFTYQVDFVVHSSTSFYSQVRYIFLAVAIGDVLPYH